MKHALSTCLEPLFADRHLLVLNKPAGLLAVPGRGADGADNLCSRVLALYPDALVVHRLDQATSGLLVMARDPASQRHLSMQFEQRLVTKVYEAVADGLLQMDQGVIELPLMADWPRRPMQKVDPSLGKPSLTRWSVLSRDRAAGNTRLSLLPLTGRTHQLRVHLAAIGHPIVGDRLYGAAQNGAPRLMLHATELGFRHPATGEALRLHSVAPF
jgi:tRNA pseudouridine32 synthase/23S rRNA pseudouridine746 synthase